MLEPAITEMYFSSSMIAHTSGHLERQRKKWNYIACKFHLSAKQDPVSLSHSCLSLHVQNVFNSFMCSMFLLIIYCSFSWYKHNRVYECGVCVHATKFFVFFVLCFLCSEEKERQRQTLNENLKRQPTILCYLLKISWKCLRD